MTAIKDINIQKSLEVIREFHESIPETGDAGLMRKKIHAEKALAHLMNLLGAKNANGEEKKEGDQPDKTAPEADCCGLCSEMASDG